MTRIDAIECMLEPDQEGALPRVSLGNECYCAHDPANAMTHLRRAVEHDPNYSAAWRALGKTAERCDDANAAADACRHGIEAAQRRGDKQAADEIHLFLRRLEKGSR